MPKIEASSPAEGMNGGPWKYTISVRDDRKTNGQIAFECAVQSDGRLQLIHAVTPYELQIEAATLVGLFQASDPATRLRVQVWSALNNWKQVVAGFTGIAGWLLEDRNDPFMKTKSTTIWIPGPQDPVRDNLHERRAT